MKRARHHDLTLAALVGARMRDFRLERGLSLVQLHKRGAPTPSQLSLIERGIVDVTAKTVCNVAKALNMRPWQMFADDPELASLDLGEAKRILFIYPEFVLPKRTEPPRAKPWHWKNKQRAAKGGR